MNVQTTVETRMVPNTISERIKQLELQLESLKRDYKLAEQRIKSDIKALENMLENDTL